MDRPTHDALGSGSSQRGGPDDAHTPTRPASVHYRRPSVRLRRIDSSGSTSTRFGQNPNAPTRQGGQSGDWHNGNNVQRSWPNNFGGSSRLPGASEPERALTADTVTARVGQLQRERVSPEMPRLTEEGPRPAPAELASADATSPTAPRAREAAAYGPQRGERPGPERRGRKLVHTASRFLGWRPGQGGGVASRNPERHHADGRGEIDDGLVDLLDVIGESRSGPRTCRISFHDANLANGSRGINAIYLN
jgi:hypothetical protein